MKTIIHSYCKGNSYTRDLARELGIKRHVVAPIGPDVGCIINWGDSKLVAPGVGIANYHGAVASAINKLETFEILEQHRVEHVPVTTNPVVAAEWSGHGYTVFGRDKVEGSRGEGITVYTPTGDFIQEHKFYTKWIKPKREFRIHVGWNKVIFQQEKLKKRGVEHDPYIRSHARGWVMCFKHLEQNPIPDFAQLVAIDAVDALNLHFGAVDMVEDMHGEFYVLEVNTAPALDGVSTLKAYVDMFRKELHLGHAD